MARRTFYTYNPHTLNYEKARTSFKKRMFAFVKTLLLGALLGAGVFLALNYWIDSPREAQLLKEQEELLAQYSLMEKNLDEALAVLEDIRQRDDNLYRVILQGDPVPLAARKATPGENRYAELSNLPNDKLVRATAQKMDMLRRQLYVQSKSINEIVELGKTHEDRLSKIPSIQPVSNKDLKRTASGYGMRIDPIYKTRKFHSGMDFAAPIGTPVHVTGDGVVVKTGWIQGYGMTVTVDHGYGYRTLYAHLSKINTHQGKKVMRGEVIAEVGNTGKSTGPHLHYEVRYKGQPTNPINYYYMDLSPEEYDRMIQIAENHGQVMD